MGWRVGVRVEGVVGGVWGCVYGDMGVIAVTRRCVVCQRRVMCIVRGAGGVVG